MTFLLIAAILVAIALVIGWPLLRGVAAEGENVGERDRLEAAKEAKYREIRDAELDHRTGKLDEADWRAIDRQLRAEAIEILRALDGLGAGPGDPAA